MRTERYNIYDKVHSDLRKQLLDAGLKIQLTDFSKPEQSKRTFAIINNVISCFERYLEEDIMIYHAIAPVAPYIIVIMEKVNEKNQGLTVTLREKIEQYTWLRTGRIRKNAGMEIQGLFFEFTASVLQNMNKEQTVINELLWEGYTDTELVQMENELVHKIAPKETGFYSKEGLNSMSRSSSVKWSPLLFRLSAPFNQNNLLRTAGNIIPPENWNIIKRHFNSLFCIV